MDFDKQQAKELLKEFIALEEWEEKYLALVQLGRLLPKIPEIKKPENLVNGCSSKVWIEVVIDKGLVSLKINSDSIIVSGLMVILLLHLNQKTPNEILAFKFSELDYINLQKYLSINRQKGFLSSFKKIKQHLISLS